LPDNGVVGIPEDVRGVGEDGGDESKCGGISTTRSRTCCPACASSGKLPGPELKIFWLCAP